MNKVYIVMYHADVGESWIDSVFSTRDAVEKHIIWCHERGLATDSTYEIIEEIVVNV